MIPARGAEPVGVPLRAKLRLTLERSALTPDPLAPGGEGAFCLPAAPRRRASQDIAAYSGAGHLTPSRWRKVC
jgi:hypothetical protein